jgi:DNA-binding NarL/FixJ family response regulator
MKSRGRRRHRLDCTQQIKEAKNRIAQVEVRIRRAKSRIELAEQRTELAETRTELAETRTALAEARAEQAEATLQRIIQHTTRQSNGHTVDANGHQGNALERLSSRQREILQHIAEGQNTKQIADVLSLSPKTVEYHRAKLMRALDVYDIPALVRLAVRAGLVPAEG